MDKKDRYNSPSPWEEQFAYCRLIKRGNFAWLSGTMAVDENNAIIGANDIKKQTEFIFEKAEKYINLAGFSKYDVVRTRMYITNILVADEVGMAHGKFFHKIDPTATMVAVAELIHPDALIEIEMDLAR